MKIEGLTAHTVPTIEEPIIGIPSNMEISDEVRSDQARDLAVQSSAVAEIVVDKLQNLLDNENLSVQDVKDITSMLKDVGQFLKSQGVQSGGGGEDALASFVARLKA